MAYETDAPVITAREQHLAAARAQLEVALRYAQIAKNLRDSQTDSGLGLEQVG